MDTIVAPPKAGAPPPDPTKEVDVVVVCQGAADLASWAAAWPKLKKYSLIAISLGGDKISVPAGFTGKAYSRSDIEAVLGGPDASLDGASLKCAAAALARKKYVVVLESSTLPAKDPKGLEVDPVEVHHTNLSRPSTPFFFNTLYDPYREGADFVRGYPFSLRDGLVTAVSHGLWLGAPDLDAATALAKPTMKNERYVDATLTLPKAVLYPMSAINLGFNRAEVGVCMYSAPLAAGVKDGSAYDDMFAGWCSKVVCDHLNKGHKTGLPYVTRQKTAAPVANMQQAVAGWKEEVWKFFQDVKLSADSATPEAAYVELAGKIRSALGPVDAHFNSVADAMTKWVAVYHKLSAANV